MDIEEVEDYKWIVITMCTPTSLLGIVLASSICQSSTTEQTMSDLQLYVYIYIYIGVWRLFLYNAVVLNTQMHAYV